MTEGTVPLCVDLDRTITPIDTAAETLLAFIRQSPGALLRVLNWRRAGAMHLRRQLATHSGYGVAHVPLHQDLLTWLQAQHALGRRLVLATSADVRIAADFAAHIAIFDDVIGPDGTERRGDTAKRRALVERFGKRGFDYVGADSGDDEIWDSTRRAIVVGDAKLAERVGRHTEVERTFSAARAGPRTWTRAIRVHQWVKNALIFVPALLAHSILSPGVLAHGVLAFLAFGLCASGVYIVNDLLDLASDRMHPRKRERPFAAGVISARNGLIVAAALLISAAVLALAINLRFAAVLAGYYTLTLAYSVQLKRVALLDVMILAALYTIRIIAGAAATDVRVSFWLLAFSVFIFLSLGFVKRYSELDVIRRNDQRGAPGRGYGTDDLPLIMSLGTSSGYCAIVVMALYINSADSAALYHHHTPLWLICPLMLFWISRVWTLTARGQMHDDPVVFALRDRTSLAIFGSLGLIVALSI